MRVRKNAIHLTATERDNFLRAVLTLKNTIANPGDPPTAVSAGDVVHVRLRA